MEAVVAGSNTEAAHKTVSLVVDGKTLESKQVNVPANGRATVEFTALESPYGFHRGEVRIDSADRLPGDDRFPFAVERADPNRILFLHQGGQGRDLLYFKTALESAAEAGFLVEPLAVEQAGGQSLSKYPFVVLSDAGTLPAGLEDNLRAYVRNGGSLLIALGPASAACRTVPVFGEPILDTQYSSREGDRFQTVASADPDYPPIAATNKLDGIEFYQTIRVQPGNARVAAKLGDGTPLLLEKSMGEGRVVVFASTFDNISNDFPLHASFLPFIEQTARYLGGQQERSSNLAVDDYVELRSAKDRGAAAEVIDPDGKRPLSLKEASSAQSFKVTREGFYEVHRANGRQELVAVHSDRRESDLSVIPAETLELWRNTGRGTGAPAAASGRESGAAQVTVALRAICSLVARDYGVYIGGKISFGREGGRMNALDQLNGYLRSIEKRLRLFAVSRGAAILVAVALLLTVVLVVIVNRYAFSEPSLIVARFVLFVALGAAFAFGLLLPLLRLTRRNAARRAEARFPEFKEGLLTVAEDKNSGNPFVDLIAGHAMEVARANAPERLVSSGAIFGFVGTAALAAVVLAWLFLAGPGYLGYGTSVLWAGVSRDGAHALYDIAVSPGDRTVRRRSDQLITAQPMGFQTDKVRLYARYGGATKWDQVMMQPQPHGSAFEFLFGGLADNVEYYVEAGAVRSKRYNLRVVDLPGVKKIRVTYHYPAWTGMQPKTEDPGGDLRAVQGTEADIAVETDRPLAKRRADAQRRFANRA